MSQIMQYQISHHEHAEWSDDTLHWFIVRAGFFKNAVDFSIGQTDRKFCFWVVSLCSLMCKSKV